MRFIRLLLLAASVVGIMAGADLACESNNSASAAYNWDNPVAWNCYSQRKTLVANEYPGKNYPTNNYVVILGLATNSNIITEHSMNVDTTLGLGGKGYARWSVTGVADNGAGLIRVTTAANTIATGDKVYCYGWNGTNGNYGYGVWTATSIDTTHFDLQGSTYTGMSAQTSGYCEIPAAVKRQGYGSNANTVGKWKINAGVTARFRGDVVDSWDNPTRQGAAPDWDTSFWMVRMGDPTLGGATWIWDGSGPTYYKTTYDTATVAQAVHLSYYIRGTAAQHSTVKCLDGSSPCVAAKAGRFTGYRDYRAIAGVDVDYADFSNLGPNGTASATWLAFYSDGSTVFRLKHFTVANSPGIKVANGIRMPASYFTMAYGKFESTSCNNSGTGCLNSDTAVAGNLVTVGPAVVFEPQRAPVYIQGGGIVFDRAYFGLPPTIYGGSTVGSEARDSIIAKLDTQNISPYGLENLVNSFVWQAHYPDGNPHNLCIPYAPNGVIMTQMTIDGNVFQGEDLYTDGVGQMLDSCTINSVASPPVYVTVKNNIMIPGFEFDGGAATNWHSSNSMAMASAFAAGTYWKFYNNTLFPTTEGGAALWLDHGSYHVPAGAMQEFRCNAVTVSSAASGRQLINTETPSTAIADAILPAGIHHNAGFGSIQPNSDSTATNSTGTYYKVKLSAAPAGATNGSDKYYPNQMPKVADRTRRLRTWANQKYGQSFANDTEVLGYLRADYNRLLDVPDLVSWLKAGWTLNEPSLYKACGDGTHIGAAVAPAAGDPAAWGAIVARSEPRMPIGALAALD